MIEWRPRQARRSLKRSLHSYLVSHSGMLIGFQTIHCSMVGSAERQLSQHCYSPKTMTVEVLANKSSSTSSGDSVFTKKIVKTCFKSCFEVKHLDTAGIGNPGCSKIRFGPWCLDPLSDVVGKLLALNWWLKPVVWSVATTARLSAAATGPFDAVSRSGHPRSC